MRLSTSRRTTRSPRTALTSTPTPSRGGTARSRRTRPSRATRRTSTTRSPRRSRPTTSLTPTAVGASSSSTGSASDAQTSYPSLASSWARPASSALSRPRAPCGCLPPTATTWTSPPPIGTPLSLECPDYNDPNYAKSACGVIQGRALSTILSVCFLHEICHPVQRDVSKKQNTELLLLEVRRFLDS